MHETIEILNNALIPWVAEVRALFIEADDIQAVNELLPQHPVLLTGTRYLLQYDTIQDVDPAETPAKPYSRGKV